MDKNEIERLIQWWKGIDTQGPNIVEYLIDPLMKAFGDDVNEILAYLNDMSNDDLSIISGCFERIYGKFMTEDVWDALVALEQRIK